MTNNVKKGGRPKGSTNKLTRDVKQTLFNSLNEDYKKVGKLIGSGGTQPKERVALLIKLLDFIAPKGHSTCKEADEIMATLCISLKGEYKRLPSYISHLQGEEKVKSLIALLKNISPNSKSTPHP